MTLTTEARSVLTIGLLSAAAMALGLAQKTSDSKFVAADHPAAVLAWAHAACGLTGALVPGAPRAHAEDLRAVGAAFDVRARHGAKTEACNQAALLAVPVTIDGGSSETAWRLALQRP